MTQDPKKLLPQTIIENHIGEKGRLVKLDLYLTLSNTWEMRWLVDWGRRGLSWDTIETIRQCELV